MLNPQMTLQDFADYLTSFATNKGNQLDYSTQRIPKRAHVITVDLSTQPSNGYFKLPGAFTTIQIERVFQTSNPSIDKTGTVKLLTDEPNIGNIQNAKTLAVNDAADYGMAIANGYLTWVNQTDTSIQIALLIDIDFRPGSAKTSIVGNVTTVNSNAKVASPALQATGVNVNSLAQNGSTSYQIPAGYIAKVHYGVQADAACSPANNVTVRDPTGAVASFPFCGPNTAGYWTGNFDLPEGWFVYSTSAIANVRISLMIVCYPVT